MIGITRPEKDKTAGLHYLDIGAGQAEVEQLTSAQAASEAAKRLVVGVSQHLAGLNVLAVNAAKQLEKMLAAGYVALAGNEIKNHGGIVRIDADGS